MNGNVSAVGIVRLAVSQHGYQDSQKPIGDAAKSAAVFVTSMTQPGVV
jgi:hypothetical protein